MKVLVDADGLVFRCGFAVEKKHYLVEHRPGASVHCDSMAEVKATVKDLPEETYYIWSRTSLEPVQNALFLVNNVIEKLADRYVGSDFEFYLTPSIGNFRERIAKTHKYKGNRDTQKRPRYYREIRDYLVETYKATYSEGQEADDALGIGASQHANSVIVSLDKDLDQIPGLHYNWVKNEEYTISKKEGTLNFYSQVLSGDSTDNIFGLDGIGPVRARKMLQDCTSSKDCWEVVRAAYTDQLGESGESRAIENGQLLWIRRKENEIWTPPS